MGLILRNGSWNWKDIALSAKNWFKFIFLGLVWGSSFLWIKIALREVGPFTLVFFRVLFGAIALTIYFLIAKWKFSTKHFWILFVIGLFNVALPFTLISWAETHISSGLASILNSTVPLFTMLIASVFVHDEKLTTTRIIGLVTGFFGVIVLMSNRLSGETAAQGLGVIAMLTAAISYASSAVFARRTNHQVRFQDQALGQLTVGVLIMGPAMLLFESPVHLPSLPITLTGLAWLGVLGTCITSLFWFSLISEVGPSRTSMVTYIFPLVGVILGMVILGEPPDWRIFVGGALVLAGIIIVNRRKKLVIAPESLLPDEGNSNG
jgi:drug/metabolite transporter (DMT)-like permease